VGDIYLSARNGAESDGDFSIIKRSIDFPIKCNKTLFEPIFAKNVAVLGP
jgi:hypothetical protein